MELFNITRVYVVAVMIISYIMAHTILLLPLILTFSVGFVAGVMRHEENREVTLREYFTILMARLPMGTKINEE
jgi:hypothetical protein